VIAFELMKREKKKGREESIAEEDRGTGEGTERKRVTAAGSRDHLHLPAEVCQREQRGVRAQRRDGAEPQRPAQDPGQPVGVLGDGGDGGGGGARGALAQAESLETLQCQDAKRKKK
jgi:hypothetical protein